jgi:hypothetical protein
LGVNTHESIPVKEKVPLRLPNGCLQQIAANRFSTPQDVIAILLQGFVRPSHA